MQISSLICLIPKCCTTVPYDAKSPFANTFQWNSSLLANTTHYFFHFTKLNISINQHFVMSQQNLMPHYLILLRGEANTARSLFHHYRRAPHRRFVSVPLQTTWVQQQRGCQVETNHFCRHQRKAKFWFYFVFFLMILWFALTGVLYESQNRNIMIFYRRSQLSCALHFEFLVAGWF